jgi:hypothetical protein
LTYTNKIDVISTKGNDIDPWEVYGLGTAGTANAVYEAKKAGTDTLVATLYTKSADGGDFIISTATTTIKVLETCKYRFALIGMLNFTDTMGDAFGSFRIMLKASGYLQVQDPAHPVKHSAAGISVLQTIEITEFKMPGCALISRDLGFESGQADARPIFYARGGQSG